MPIPAIAGSPDVQPAAPAVSPDTSIAPSAPSAPADVSAPTRVAPATAQQAVVKTPDPQQAIQEHHSAIGAGVKKLLGAIHGTYSTPTYDPKTGQVVDTPVPAKPGDIFRHILAGAIMGGAAGAGAPEGQRSSLLGGFARGGAAEITDARNQRDRQLAQAQEQQKIAMEKKRLDNETLLMQGQLAHMHTEEVHQDFQADLASKEFADKGNTFNTQLEETAKDAGGQIAKIQTPDGKTIPGQMSAMDFQKNITQNPSIMNAPDKDHSRVFIRKFDTTGLTFTPATGWTDEKGQKVNPSEHTSVTAYDVPNDQFKVARKFSNGLLNQLIDPTGKTKTFENEKGETSLTLGQYVTLKTAATKILTEQAEMEYKREMIKVDQSRIAAEMAKLNKEVKLSDAADMRSQAADFRVRVDGLKEQINSLERERHDAASAFDTKEVNRIDGEIKDYRTQLDSIVSEVQTKQQEAASKGKGKGGKATPAAAPAAPAAPAAAPKQASATDDVALVKKTVKGMQGTNNTPTSYENLVSGWGKVLASNSQRVLAANQLGLTIPWTAVQEMATAAGISPEQAAEGIKRGGAKVEPRPNSGLIAPLPPQGS